MIEIGISNLAKSFGVDKIFENITFDIKEKERVGIVGKNGVGKTTLMKIIYGDEDASNGQVSIRKGLKIGYLEQVPNYSEDVLAIDILHEAFRDVYCLEKEMENLQNEFSKHFGNELDILVKKFSAIQDEYELKGGYRLKEKFNKVIAGLNIAQNLLNSKFKLLSGGEKTRIVLGKILLENPDILLLDEPSNHLDIKSVEWLEQYLSTYEGTVVIISHDRYFLDNVATKIVEITSDSADVYLGNYSKYVIQKELKFIQAMKEYEAQQRKVNKMEEQIHRYRVWGEMRDSDKMYRRAKELEKRLAKMDEIKRPVKDKKIKSFSLTTQGRSGNDVIVIDNVSKSFDDKELFTDASMTVFYKDSLCILGENGTGKSTLIKMILGSMSYDTGNIKLGSRIQIGYLPQDVRFENEEDKVVDYFSYKYGISTSEARKELAKILFFEDDVYKKIKTLSGGEKTRLKLLTIMYEKSNVLILDEPTNHLDIESRESLEEDLINYDGTIIFVSHDRYFIDKVATRIVEIENNRFKVYDFDYEGYKEQKNRVIEELKEANDNCINLETKTVSESKEDYQKKKEDARRIKKKKRDLKKLEDTIMTTEEELKTTEKLLYSNRKDIDLNEIHIKYTNLKENLNKMYEELDCMYEDEEIQQFLE
ncbi:ABC-F type ribosomal protection protein [Sedimentibacter sp. zth1]|uniref:ribosomal protection-like ABC-F family protein n=1 Tax=Sedimentibacter sp. zth1 TaxID=2816908 RepID=UPI001A91F9E5|nr:ABC-F type ribosomal protection protein [Sedimentibacter sp. zth1]QSX05759.1 ABC-F type ribosomal protection protein [Sedimentibacter sp. zth1]